MKTLKEVFALIESNGWHICTLEESPERFKDNVTVYGFSKPIDDDVICFTAILAKTDFPSRKEFKPMAINLLNYINAAWKRAANWEKPEISKLYQAVDKFILE